MRANAIRLTKGQNNVKSQAQGQYPLVPCQRCTNLYILDIL